MAAAAAERQRLREYREAFDYYDRNRDGLVDYTDFGLLLRSVGILISESEILSAKEEFAFPMTWEDFRALTASSRFSASSRSVSSAHLDAEAVRAFQTFDVRGRGKVAIKELRHFLTTLGERITHDEFDLALKYAKIPVDQAEINYTEFLRILHASSNS
jgi:Ca2+-binding EF-hand superfamily protein